MQKKFPLHLLLCAVLLFTASAHSFAQRPPTRTRVIVRHIATDTSHPILVYHAPALSKYKYINTRNSKYAAVVKGVFTTPLVPLPGDKVIPPDMAATYQDSVALTDTIASLLFTIRNNYTDAIDEYVDTTVELNKVAQLQWVNGHVYKSDITGLTHNLAMLNIIFSKPAFDEEDIDLLSYIFDTNRGILANMESTGALKMVRGVTAQFFTIDILDTAGNPLHGATCYFVTKTNWQHVAKSLKCPTAPNRPPCDSSILTGLEDMHDGVIHYLAGLDKQNQVSLMYGHYHFIIETAGVVYYHHIDDFDLNTHNPLTINLAKNGH